MLFTRWKFLKSLLNFDSRITNDERKVRMAWLRKAEIYFNY